MNIRQQQWRAWPPLLAAWQQQQIREVSLITIISAAAAAEIDSSWSVLSRAC
jgi:hypothetical protein